MAQRKVLTVATVRLWFESHLSLGLNLDRRLCCLVATKEDSVLLLKSFINSSHSMHASDNRVLPMWKSDFLLRWI